MIQDPFGELLRNALVLQQLPKAHAADGLQADEKLERRRPPTDAQLLGGPDLRDDVPLRIAGGEGAAAAPQAAHWRTRAVGRGAELRAIRLTPEAPLHVLCEHRCGHLRPPNKSPADGVGARAGHIAELLVLVVRVLSEADEVVHSPCDAAVGHMVEDGLDRVPDGVAHVYAEHAGRQTSTAVRAVARYDLLETLAILVAPHEVTQRTTLERLARAMHQHARQLPHVLLQGELLVQVHHCVAHHA
mmetsp:Transcript_10912/g.29899  ORF Transcript_10912/g.29899 Transcript_10912/m.29899 type:complete len:245 (-) Transcript_10912:496-1230(-)